MRIFSKWFKTVCYFLLFCLPFVVCAFDAANWTGPHKGPSAQEDKTIVFISQSFKNKGILKFYDSFERATKVIGWRYLSLDGEDDSRKIKKNLTDLLMMDVDGVVIGGFSVNDYQEEIKRLKDKEMIIVGWHASKGPGSHGHLFTNVASYSTDVAQVAVEYLISSTKKVSQTKVGVVIFNDERFDVANAKTKKMIELLGKCKYCNVLETIDMNISKSSQLMRQKIIELNNKYSSEWTHSLAINDAYFNVTDFSKIRPDIINISAGDGSSDALERIRWGNSSQKASVAEPIDFQAWQLVDELNRAFAGLEPSSIVASPVLITKESFKDNKLSSPSMTTNHHKIFIDTWHPSSLKKYIR